nr:hypothetical protein [Clostridium sp. SM-530-WT-3G]
MPHIPEIIDEIADSNMQRLKKTSEACEEIGKEISKIQPETIVILSPHGNLRENFFTISMGEYIYGNFKEFKNVDISFVVKLDNIFSRGVIDYFESNSINYTVNDSESKNYKLDHGSMVPLYFINKNYRNYELVTINTSIIDSNRLFEFGKAIRKISEIQGKKIVVIASCDIANNEEFKTIHNESYKTRSNIRGSNIIDNIKVMENSTFKIDKFKEFQKYNIIYMPFMLGVLDEREVRGKFLSYEKKINNIYALIKLETN